MLDMYLEARSLVQEDMAAMAGVDIEAIVLRIPEQSQARCAWPDARHQAAVARESPNAWPH